LSICECWGSLAHIRVWIWVRGFCTIVKFVLWVLVGWVLKVSERVECDIGCDCSFEGRAWMLLYLVESRSLKSLCETSECECESEGQVVLLRVVIGV
jgi:hypothetical protein